MEFASMGIYERKILPWLVLFSMGGKDLHSERQSALAETQGHVLEVGFGNGLNLRHYPDAVHDIVGIDPSPMADRLARKEVSRYGKPVAIHTGSAEAMPFENATFDTVTMTWTLCTIPDPQLALAEIKRVIKPDGRLHFVEHGRSPDPGVARWQRRLNGLQRFIGGGCNLDRKIDDLIAGAGFRMESVESYYIKGPRTHCFFYRGVASKSGAAG